MGEGGVGGLGEQPAGALLHPDCGGPQAPGRGARRVRARDYRNPEGARDMNIIRRLQYLLHSRRMERELAEEMEFHQAMVGRRAMGASTQMREEARAVWVWPWLESIGQDA